MIRNQWLTDTVKVFKLFHFTSLHLNFISYCQQVRGVCFFGELLGFTTKTPKVYFSYWFCPFGYFENFDSISISLISDQKRGKIIFIPILSIWIFWKTLTASVCHWFRIKKGGKLFSYQFCPFGYFENFDSISMLKKAWHFLKTPWNVW